MNNCCVIFIVLFAATDLQTLTSTSWEVSSSSGEKVVVVDGGMDHTTFDLLLEYVSEYWTWIYKETDHQECGRDGLWTAKKHKSYLKQTRFVKTAKELAFQSYGGDGSLELQEIEARAIRRGDANFVEDRTCHNQTIVFIVFLCHDKDWQKNHYGELILWDTNGLLLTAIRPTFGRIVMFPSDLLFLYKPPSMATVGTQIMLQLIFSLNSDYEQHSLSNKDNDIMRDSGFPMGKSPDNPLIDIKSHITRHFYSKDGLQVIILDNIFSEDDLNMLRNFVLENGTYNFDLSSESADNVQWITGYEVEEFVKSHIWAQTKQVVDHVLGRDDYYPYDVTCNLIRTFDHPQIHTDSQPMFNEYTFLLYLNPDWEADWHGETSFYEKTADEPFAAIQPRYGRIALFQGEIHHSGHPPSLAFPEARLTFAVKMLPEREAREHLRLEEVHGFEEVIDSLAGEEAKLLKQVVQDVKNGLLETSTVGEVMHKAFMVSEHSLLNQL
jgi:Rps23 Pro-64 3,4-dihydroxylase Tpa1-like proline 4-hydroxylase